MSKKEEYVEEFKRFNADTAKEYRSEAAPHQPILLLSLIKLFEENKIDLSYIDPKSVLDPDSNLRKLTDEFWWEVEDEDSRFSIRYPFYHLEEKDFWRWKLNEDFTSAIQGKAPTLGELKTRIKKVYLSKDLIELIDQEETREELIKALIKSGKKEGGKKHRCFIGEGRKAIREKMGLEFSN